MNNDPSFHKAISFMALFKIHLERYEIEHDQSYDRRELRFPWKDRIMQLTVTDNGVIMASEQRMKGEIASFDTTTHRARELTLHIHKYRTRGI